MKQRRFGKGLATALLAVIVILPLTGQADSPGNLDIVWARTAGPIGTTAGTAPIYSQKTVRSKVVKHYSHKHVVHIAGMEKDENGQDWYEVVWPFKGWLRASDTWFAPQLGGYHPERLPGPERLSLRIKTDIGNYPAATIKVLGEPKSQSYRVDKSIGSVVVQTLKWKGTVIEYHNSYTKENLAWINGVTLGQGSQVSFGPIHIGDPAEKLGIFGIEKTFPSTEVAFGTNVERFRFIVRNGRIDCMSYRHGVDGDFLPAQ